MAYPLPLDTAYRLSGTEAEILDFQPEREFRSSRRHFKTLSLDELRSPDFNLLSDQEYSEEEEAKAMAETMEQYMSKTRTDYGSGVARPKIDNKDQFKLKGQFFKELRENTFSGWDNENANEHIEKFLKISLSKKRTNWFDQTWEDFKTKFLNKYCPPGQTAKKIKEINNFQQESDETLFQAWERFKELLMKCPQHYLTEMQKVILFYNGLDIPTRQILDSRRAIPTKTVEDAKKAIQKMAEYSQKWHNRTSRGRSTDTSDGLATIQAQLNNLGREIKKVNGKVYAAQLGYAAIRNQGASIKTLEIQIGQMTKISTTIEADSHSTRHIGSSQYAVSTRQNSTLLYKSRQTTVPFLSHLDNHYCEEEEGNHGPKFTEAYGASHVNDIIPRKEKDQRSFTLPCFSNDVCFDNALVDLGASVSVMPLSTYLNLGLGELAHTRLTVELADRTVKYPKGIAENVLVGI
ncbi:NUDIX hydrolase 6-like protein, partial [Tanacetum coccineum]